MKTIKIQHPTIYPNGEWVCIGSDEEANLDKDAFMDGREETILDEEIYFYFETIAQVEAIKVGDTIELDEEFQVLEVEE